MTPTEVPESNLDRCWSTASFASLELPGLSQIDMLGVRYKAVNLEAGNQLWSGESTLERGIDAGAGKSPGVGVGSQLWSRKGPGLTTSVRSKRLRQC